MASVRDVFFNEIYNQVKQGEEIYIITSDLGAPSLDAFRRDYPEKYLSVGIAEQNLITIASGMAMGGAKVIAYGLNPFPITRAYDQIRCLLAELKIPITLCVLNAGLCSAECGYTHMPIEDIGMLRMLSNIDIYNPTDEVIARKLANETVYSSTPRIIRFDKALNIEIYRSHEINLKKGFVANGDDNAKKIIITHGIYAKELYERIHDFDEKVKIIDIFKLPMDKEQLVKELNGCKYVFSVEENVLPGGIGSMVLEIISDYNLSIKCKRFGLDFSKGYYNVFTDRNYIRNNQGIDIETIITEINNY